MDHHIDRVCVVFAFHLVLNIEVFIKGTFILLNGNYDMNGNIYYEE